MGNPDKLNEAQVWYFINDQEILTVEEAIVSHSGIKIILDSEELESDVKHFLDLFKSFSPNAPTDVEGVELIQLEKPFVEISHETEAPQTIIDIIPSDTPLKEMSDNIFSRFFNKFFS